MLIKCNLVYTAETYDFNIDGFIEYCRANFPELVWERGGIVYCIKGDEGMLVKEYADWLKVRQ
jgi:hypothetical protein